MYIVCECICVVCWVGFLFECKCVAGELGLHGVTLTQYGTLHTGYCSRCVSCTRRPPILPSKGVMSTSYVSTLLLGREDTSTAPCNCSLPSYLCRCKTTTSNGMTGSPATLLFYPLVSRFAIVLHHRHGVPLPFLTQFSLLMSS